MLDIRVNCVARSFSAIAELERMDPYSPHDSISVTNFLHRRGINMRLLGKSVERKLPEKGTVFSWWRPAVHSISQVVALFVVDMPP